MPASSLLRTDPAMRIRSQFVFWLLPLPSRSRGFGFPPAELGGHLGAVVARASRDSIGQRGDGGEREPSGPQPCRESAGGGGVSPSCRRGGTSPFALAMKSVMCRFLSSPGGWGKECGLGEV